MFPLGLAYIAAALKKESFEVQILDMIFENAELEEVINNFQPDFIGLSIRNIDDAKFNRTKYFIPDCHQIVTRIRAASTSKVIVGGSGFSLFPEQILDLTGADYGIVGEAEKSIVKLLKLLSKTTGSLNEKLENIEGLVFREKNSIKKNSTVISGHRDIVSPLFTENLLKNYLLNSSMAGIQTQRGCPFNCNYCSYPLIEGHNVRYRDPEEVAEDISLAVRSGARYFFIVDSVFNISNDHVAEVCNQIIRRNLKIEWGCFLRPSGITEEIIKLMVMAGLKHIEFGSDSFCDEVLSDYGKKFTYEDILLSSEIAAGMDVNYAHFLIMGGPGETESTMLTSFKNSLCLKKTVIFPFIGMRLFPKTALYERAIRENIISKEHSLLEPFFYISPDIKAGQIETLLLDFQNRSPRWIFEDRTPQQQAIINRLRAKGIKGPLWEFLTS